jgi:hypothetical protein
MNLHFRYQLPILAHLDLGWNDSDTLMNENFTFCTVFWKSSLSKDIDFGTVFSGPRGG